MIDSAFHGGNIRQAANQFGIADDEWLDLSTGINPTSYPLPAVPQTVWQKLPYDDELLLTKARRYYCTDHLVAVTGSQQAIELLPRVLSASNGQLKVAVISPSYAEHALQWQRAGHNVTCVDAAGAEAEILLWDVVVVVRPSNPTTEVIDRRRLDEWHAELRRRGGWLIVDEAFVDAELDYEQLTCITPVMPQGLIILRSIGKFFGLAGIRLGFVIANEFCVNLLKKECGLWGVSGLAQWAGQQCLTDSSWQRDMRTNLNKQSHRLSQLLDQYHMSHSRSPLFCYIPTDKAELIYRSLARRGILIRLFKHPPALRIGLPHKEQSWRRLGAALHDISSL